MRSLGTPLLIHQPKYSMFQRDAEEGLLDALRDEGIGCIAFSPLAQGLLTDRYLGGIPQDSRAAKPDSALRPESVTAEREDMARRLNALARQRGQTLAQMALAWVLRHPEMTSALIGASRTTQLEDAVGALNHLGFEPGELQAIEQILAH